MIHRTTFILTVIIAFFAFLLGVSVIFDFNTPSHYQGMLKQIESDTQKFKVEKIEKDEVKEISDENPQETKITTKSVPLKEVKTETAEPTPQKVTR